MNILKKQKSLLLSVVSVFLSLVLLLVSCSNKNDNNDSSKETTQKQTNTIVTTTQENNGTPPPQTLYDRLEAIAISSQIYNVTGLHSGASLVYDKNKNEILYSNEDINASLFPASTTKLLTALYALSVAELNYKITVGAEQQLVAGDSSKAGIRQGETYTLKELIGLMLIPSGNDAAYAIARGVGATLCREGCSNGEALHAFCDGMNAYAKTELGLDNTNFITPDGYHDDAHVTTLLDMLKISVAASENKTIMEFAGMVEYTCNSSSGRSITVYNTNSLLSSNKYVTGLKTGHTSAAGRCICVSYDDGDNSLIILVFNVKKEYNDANSDTYYRNKNVNVLIDYFIKLA